MKKLLLILLLFIVYEGVSEAQSWIYHPFPTSDALWRESSGDYPCNCCRDYQYTMPGDTLVGGVTYHKLNSTGTIYYDPNPAYPGWTSYFGCGGGPSYYLHSTVAIFYAGAFREDVPNRKVYFIEPGSSTDTLLYNFNLAVGDTLPPTYGSGYINNYVSSVDSVLVGGVYHKQFNIGADSYPSYASIIEGVGSTFGLLGHLYPPFEASASLNCFWQNDTLAYPVGSGCQPLSTGIKEMDFSKTVSVYPNPSEGNYQLNMDYVNNTVVDITDVLGKTVATLKVKDSKTLIDLTDQPQGIYFLMIRDESGHVLTKKIVKQ